MVINYRSFLYLIALSVFTTLVMYSRVLILFDEENHHVSQSEASDSQPQKENHHVSQTEASDSQPRKEAKQVVKFPPKKNETKPVFKFPPMRNVTTYEPQCCDFEEVLSFERVTIVTGFINIGTKRGSKFSKETYMQWSNGFARVTNPVYAFFTDDEDIRNFRKLRKTLPETSTKIVKVDIDKTWAFSLHHNIENIFARQHYPVHRPNTVMPSYPCCMNAKYEFILQAVEENPFKTDYFSWMDLGYLRHIVNISNTPLLLHVPAHFNHHHSVAYNEVYHRYNAILNAEYIVRYNLVWVGGGFFIGRGNVLKKMVSQYKATVAAMMALGWVSTDQQVLYYMVQPHNNLTKEVGIQAYKGDWYGDWFNLGFLCMCNVKYECVSFNAKNDTEKG